MTQVRQVIELLTNILTDNGTSPVRAEMFRLAKFDNDDVTIEMWKLLFETLYFSLYGTIDDTAIKALVEMTPAEIVAYVKRELQELGYLSADFARLPLSMEYGSREILLAFAWLFVKKSLFNKFVENCTSPITETSETLGESCFSLGDNIDKEQVFADLLNGKSEEQKLQQMVMLNGKLQHHMKKMYAAQLEASVLQHKVHEATTGVALDPRTNHLSLHETKLLRHPNELKKVIHLLENDNKRLKNLLEWRTKEDVFWKWMDSVLDLKAKEKGDNGVKVLRNNLEPQYYVNADLNTMKKNHDELREAIIRYETVIDKLEDIWETRSTEIPQQQLDYLISSLDTEIAIQKAKLPIMEMSQSENSNLYIPQFHFIPNSQKSKNPSSAFLMMDGPANIDIGYIECNSILVEINDLEDKINKIEGDIERTQEDWKNKLQDYAAYIPDSICIDPVTRR